MKNWAEDIKTKTKNMNRDQKVEYVMTYYWYHILLAVLTAGLLILGIYHVSWGKRRTDFSLVIVNQDINSSRDEKIQEEYARFCGIPEKFVQADSDYMISYGDVKLEGINESSYEKFFFGWAAGVIDAVVMPESFYHYCKEQNGTYVALADLLEEAGIADGMLDERPDIFLEDNGVRTGIYVEKTCMSGYFMQNEDDPYVLVFPADMKHRQAAGKFLEYSLQQADEGNAQSDGAVPGEGGAEK